MSDLQGTNDPNDKAILQAILCLSNAQGVRDMVDGVERINSMIIMEGANHPEGALHFNKNMLDIMDRFSLGIEKGIEGGGFYEWMHTNRRGINLAADWTNNAAQSAILISGYASWMHNNKPIKTKDQIRDEYNQEAGLENQRIVNKAIETAQQNHKGGETTAGHALQKHAGRNPDIWEKVSGGSDQINQQAMNHIDDIINAPGEFKVTTTSRGVQFLEKTLPDGRGMRLNLDGTFKGFIDEVR